MSETIAIAADHGGYSLKEKVKDLLDDMGFGVMDLGTHDEDAVDYPDYANSLAGTLLDGDAKWGVLVCGSGIGISIAANRHKHIRAALCHNDETATLAKQHNHANVLVLGARTTEEDAALSCVKTFFSTEFEDAERHHRRVGKIS